MTTIRPFTCDDLFKFNGINLGRKLLRVAGVSKTQIGFIANPAPSFGWIQNFYLSGSCFHIPQCKLGGKTAQQSTISSFNYITLAFRIEVNLVFWTKMDMRGVESKIILLKR